MQARDAQPGTVIVGMGDTGFSCARFLAARGERFALVDSRAAPPLEARLRAAFPDAPLRTGGFDAELLGGAARIVFSPGVDRREDVFRAAHARGAELPGDIELFWRAARAPVVGITGTNAKSTVTTLVWKMAEAAGLRVACGGNLGTPALDLLDDAVELYVLELSSFQLELVDGFRADVAVILNIAPDHLDRYAGMQEYAEAKQRIHRGARHVVFNRDDAATRPAGAAAAVSSFGLDAPADGEYGLRETADGVFLAAGDELLLPLADMRMRGRHNAANALAAMAVADAAGIARAAQLAVLRDFAGLPHRCEFVVTIDGVDYVDDSKGTNVAASVAALRGLGSGAGRIVLIAGGIAKESDFGPLVEEARRCARAIVLIGRDAPLLGAALDGVVPVAHAGGMDDAVAQARAIARPGDIVLLSPACASFDMFANYRRRGEAFAAAARRPTGEVR